MPDPLRMPGGGKLAVVPLTTKELKRKRRKEKKREKKRREKERKKRLKDQQKQRQKDKQAKEGDIKNADEKAKSHESQGEAEDDTEAAAEELDDEKDLHPLEMPKIDSDNTDSNEEEAETAMVRIEDNNLLGDTYFDVKSDHCLMPLLPQQNSYNRNMVLSMGHSGVKFIIEKISQSLESELQVREVRDKIMHRQLPSGEKAPVQIDPALIEDARKMGREGILTSMVLFDMNKQEAKEMATRNFLEYRSAAAQPEGPGLSNQPTGDQTEATSEEGSSGQVSVRKVKQGNVLVTETVAECSREKLIDVISAPLDKRPKTSGAGSLIK